MPEKKYLVVITGSVQKTLSKFPDKIASKLEKVMLRLENNPRPLGCKKLKGRDSYRIREGDYRIIYEIEANILTVIVVMQATEKIFMNKSILAYTIALKTSLSIKLPSLLLSNCG